MKSKPTYQELENRVKELEEYKNTSKATITELKLAEEKFRTIADYTYDWEYWIDTNRNFIYISPSCERITGYKPKEFLENPKLLFKIVHPDDINNFENHTNEVFGTGGLKPVDFRIITKTNKTRWIGHICQTVYNSKGENIGQRASNRDITYKKEIEQAVKKEHTRFKNIMDTNPSGIYIANKQNDIEYVNPILKKEFGQINGRKCYSYFHDLAKPCAWCKNKEVFAGKSVRWEWFSKRNNKYYELFDTPLENPDGTVSKFEIFFDITERKNAEKALKESEEKYRNIIENMLDGFYKADANGNVTLINSSITKILGFSKDEIIGKPVASFYAHSNERKLFLEKIKEKGSVENYPAELQRKEKSNILIETNAQIIFKNGEYDGVEGVFRNVTERKQIQQALKQSEENYRLLTETMKDVVVKISTTGELLYVSPATEKFGGYKPEEETGNDISKYFAEKNDYQRAVKLITEVIETHKSGNFEFMYKPKNKAPFPVEHTFVPLISNNKVYAIQMVLRDITDRKKAEQALKESETKLKISNNTKDKFFSIISHDLRSPFNALLGFSKILLRKHKEYDDEKREHLIKSIHNSANSAYKLLENLLTWSRSQSGKIKYLPEKLDLKTLLFETLFDLQGQADKKKHSNFKYNFRK